MVAISGSFTNQNTWAGGIRRGQAEEAFGAPDARIDIDLGPGASLTLVTKKVDRPRSHVILLIASESGGQPQAIASGYRLYGSAAELKALGGDPRLALDELIRRFGRDFTINGGTPTKFVESLHLDVKDVAIDPGDGDVTVMSFARGGGVRGFDLSYVWVIDEARYKAALASN